MGAHILLVSEQNFDICVRLGVYGCVLPGKEWNKAEIIAGVLSIQTGDLVFFYVKNKGIYGVWKVVGQPFYDETDIWKNEEQKYPFRFSFTPTIALFPAPILLSDILDLHDKGRIWTFDLNPVQQKNQYKITLDEAKELLRLLLRNNPVRESCSEYYEIWKPQNPTEISIDFSSSVDGRFRYEGWLNAWFIKALFEGSLKELFGEYREFINLVPTTFNKVMDIFLTHITNVDGMDILHKYSCIELKVDRADENDLSQVLRYEDWLARKLAAGDHEMIQSVLVASRFSEKLINYVMNRRKIEEKVVRLIRYEVKSQHEVCLEEIIK